jgi:hypothetical protein
MASLPPRTNSNSAVEWSPWIVDTEFAPLRQFSRIYTSIKLQGEDWYAMQFAGTLRRNEGGDSTTMRPVALSPPLALIT